MIIMNILDKIDSDETILCNDGVSTFTCNYKNLIKEIIENTEETTDGYRNSSESLVVNGLKCRIKFNGLTGQYNGYVVDDIVKNINENDIDYSPHGGFTAGWGFDCLHHTDISLNPMMNMSSFDPEILKLPFSIKGQKGMFKDSNASFKTKKFVINELNKLTKSIIKYQSHKSQNVS